MEPEGSFAGGQFAVAVGLFRDNAPIVGCLVCPRLPFPTLEAEELGSVLFWEQGARPLHYPLNRLDEKNAMTLPVLTEARSVLLRSFESDHGNFEFHEPLVRELGIGAVLRMDSQAKYAVLARGEATAYFRMPRTAADSEKSWDHAAGVALVLAAGGGASSTSGRALRLDGHETLETGTGVFATLGLEHDQALATLLRLQR